MLLLMWLATTLLTLRKQQSESLLMLDYIPKSSLTLYGGLLLRK